MAFSYGFFSSKNGDRRYNAKQFGSIFDGIINDGVYDTIGDRFLVTSKKDGFKVYVGTGRAWFLHTWTLNTSELPISISSPEPLLDRWDTIILEIDHREDFRRNRIYAVKGTPANNPQKPAFPGSWEDTNDLKQIPLAYVKVNAGSTYINPEDIDWRVGKKECPIIIAPVVGHMTADELIVQWKNQWDAWVEHNGIAWDAWVEHNGIAWWEWFNNLQYVLDGDVAGHLQEQIDWIRKFSSIYVVDKVLYVPMSGASVSDNKLIFAQDH